MASAWVSCIKEHAMRGQEPEGPTQQEVRWQLNLMTTLTCRKGWVMLVGRSWSLWSIDFPREPVTFYTSCMGVNDWHGKGNRWSGRAPTTCSEDTNSSDGAPKLASPAKKDSDSALGSLGFPIPAPLIETYLIRPLRARHLRLDPSPDLPLHQPQEVRTTGASADSKIEWCSGQPRT